MDQVKAQLAVVMKYGFWISSVIVLIGSVVIWYLTTSKLSEEYTDQSGKIKSAVQQVKSVELATHPNDHSHVIMEEMIDARRDEVLESWQTLFERQQEILKWPTDVFTADLIDEYKDNIPIETFVAHPTLEADELETSLRGQYATYIQEVLPDLAAIAGTEWTASFEASGMSMEMGMNGGGFGGGMSMMGAGGEDVDITGATDGPLVIWEGGSQSAVLKDMFPWRGSLPSTLEIYYSQENLWILRQLMQIVAEVNGDVTQSYQAKIREIKQIGIGKSVKFDAGNISKPGSSGSGMMGGGMEMGMEMGMDMGMEMGDMEAGMNGDTGPGPDPADNRYLNALREPVTGQTLRSALTSNSPNDAALAVAKRVPIKMTLVMDQRAVPEFIAVCGSAPLMVEVSQVRVLPKDAASGAGGMMGGMMGGEMEMDGGMDGGMEEMGGGMMGGGMMGGGLMGGGMMGGGMMGGDGLPDTPVEEFPLDLYVEVYGIIYIYNPPDGEKLGVEQITEDTVVEGLPETTNTQPAATATGTDTTTPAGDTTAPAGDTTAPAGDTTAPAGDTTAPAGDTTAPAGDTTTPAGDTTTPAGDTTAPAGDTTTPAGDTTTPAGTAPVTSTNTAPSTSLVSTQP